MTGPLTPEQARALWTRAREAGRQLAEATEQLNQALKLAEERFARNLGPNARGRVSLRKNKDGWIEHLVFRQGKILYENGWPGKPLAIQPLLNASREIRMLAAYHLTELWSACGGSPLPLVAKAP